MQSNSNIQILKENNVLYIAKIEFKIESIKIILNWISSFSIYFFLPEEYYIAEFRGREELNLKLQ